MKELTPWRMTANSNADGAMYMNVYSQAALPFKVVDCLLLVFPGFYLVVASASMEMPEALPVMM